MGLRDYQPRSGWTATSIVPNPDHHAAADAALTAAPAFTADDLKTTPVALNDPKLGSKGFKSLPNGLPVNVAAQTSVYATPNIPAFLGGALNSLNAQQAARNSAYQDIFKSIFSPYLQQVGGAYETLANSQAAKSNSQVQAAGSYTSLQSQIAALQKQRDTTASPAGTFGWGNPDVNKLDQQIFNLQGQLPAAQKISSSAVGSNSGWIGAPSLSLPRI